MPIDPNKHCVVCAHPRVLPPGQRPKGVAVGNCVGCGDEVLLAKSTQDYVNEGKGQPVCRKCGYAFAKETPNARPAVLVKAVEEIKEALKKKDPERN